MKVWSIVQSSQCVRSRVSSTGHTKAISVHYAMYSGKKSVDRKKPTFKPCLF